MSSYLELLNLTREPFSNSPDPDAYYRTPTHEDCLNRLEIAIRLRRGLNVVLGEVGTGKSTLCRCLLRSLNEQSGIDVFLLLDAGFEDADEFVRHLCELFAGQRPPEGVARRECISVIQNRVFDKALEQNRNLVLFIDEGQKLSPAALEVLRELLNFETNTEKLLQIVIFGQPELAQIIEGMPNFKDRINEYLYLKPLSMRESIRLVRHRLRLAGGQRAERLFSLGSLIALHRASRGKPRQLMRLGHQMLLALLVGNRTTVTGRMVWSQVARNGSDVENRWGRWLVVALALICVAGGYRWMPEAVKDDAHARLEAVVSGVLGWLPEAEKADTAGTAGQGRAAGKGGILHCGSGGWAGCRSGKERGPRNAGDVPFAARRGSCRTGAGVVRFRLRLGTGFRQKPRVQKRYRRGASGADASRRTVCPSAVHDQGGAFKPWCVRYAGRGVYGVARLRQTLPIRGADPDLASGRRIVVSYFGSARLCVGAGRVELAFPLFSAG